MPKNVINVTISFPKDELYGMVQQVRRASVSIPANISEGYGRRAKGDYARFLNISLLGKRQKSKVKSYY